MEPDVRPDACETARALLDASCDERQPAPPPLEAHLASCLSCREHARLVRELDGILAREPWPEPPAGFAASVLSAVRADARRSRRGARAALALVPAAAAVLAVALTLGGCDLPGGAVALLADVLDLGRALRQELPPLPLVDLGPLGSLGSLSFSLEAPAAGPLAPVLAGLAFVLVTAELVWGRRLLAVRAQGRRIS